VPTGTFTITTAVVRGTHNVVERLGRSHCSLVQEGVHEADGGKAARDAGLGPWHQEEAKYLSGVPASEMPTAGTWNSSARAYPDVSAIGHNLMCVTGGNVAPVDGTSAATPIFAGILTRLKRSSAREPAASGPDLNMPPGMEMADSPRPALFPARGLVWVTKVAETEVTQGLAEGNSVMPTTPKQNTKGEGGHGEGCKQSKQAHRCDMATDWQRLEPSR